MKWLWHQLADAIKIRSLDCVAEIAEDVLNLVKCNVRNRICSFL